MMPGCHIILGVIVSVIRKSVAIAAALCLLGSISSAAQAAPAAPPDVVTTGCSGQHDLLQAFFLVHNGGRLHGYS